MSADSRFVRVARLAEIPEGKSALVRVGDEEIALWRVRGTVYAISNVCAHQHFSRLHRGILTGLTVACPMHGWTYSLETGRAVTGEGRIRTYRVNVEGGDVVLELPLLEE